MGSMPPQCAQNVGRATKTVSSACARPFGLSKLASKDGFCATAAHLKAICAAQPWWHAQLQSMHFRPFDSTMLSHTVHFRIL